MYSCPHGGSKEQPLTCFFVLLLFVSRGKLKHVGWSWCCRTSTRRRWVPARLPSSAPRPAAWAAWRLGLCPPSRTDTRRGRPLWGRWCSAWPPRVAWPCECQTAVTHRRHWRLVATTIALFFFRFPARSAWSTAKRRAFWWWCTTRQTAGASWSETRWPFLNRTSSDTASRTKTRSAPPSSLASGTMISS